MAVDLLEPIWKTGRQLSTSEKILLLRLAWFVNERELRKLTADDLSPPVYGSVRSLAHDCSLCLQTTVANLQSLLARGLLVIPDGGKGRGSRATTYQINRRAIAALHGASVLKRATQPKRARVLKDATQGKRASVARTRTQRQTASVLVSEVSVLPEAASVLVSDASVLINETKPVLTGSTQPVLTGSTYASRFALTPIARTPATNVDDSFAQFWHVYPRKTARLKALQAWRTLNPNPELVALIMRALSWQRQQPGWLKDGGAYVPYPSTWLHQGRWDDQPTDTPQLSEKTVRLAKGLRDFLK